MSTGMDEGGDNGALGASEYAILSNEHSRTSLELGTMPAMEPIFCLGDDFDAQSQLLGNRTFSSHVFLGLSPRSFVQAYPQSLVYISE